MTAYVARERLRLGETVVAPPYEALAAESLLGLEPGERIEVRDLLLGLLLVSGNDAANALAQAAAGSEDEFVRRDERRGRPARPRRHLLREPVGLDEMGNYSSARDLVDLAIELRKDALFREIFDTASTTTETGARPRNLVNRNTLVQTVPYVNGVKTGYTIDAGNVLVGSGKQDGVELVSAVLGAPSEGDRDAATMALLDYGFSLYHRRTPVRAGEPVDRVAITDREVEVVLAPRSDLRITVRKGQSVETRIEAPAEVEGPVEKRRAAGLDRGQRRRRGGGQNRADRDRERRFRQPAGALRRGDSGAANRRLGARGRRPRADLRRRRGALGPAAMIGLPASTRSASGAGFATHDELPRAPRAAGGGAGMPLRPLPRAGARAARPARPRDGADPPRAWHPAGARGLRAASGAAPGVRARADPPPAIGERLAAGSGPALGRGGRGAAAAPGGGRAAQVMTGWEADEIATALGLDRGRVHHVPWALCESGAAPPATIYPGSRAVFASGRTACDWPTLFAAADGAAWELIVACSPATPPRSAGWPGRSAAEIAVEIPWDEHDATLRAAPVYAIVLADRGLSAGHVRLMVAVEDGVPVVAAPSARSRATRSTARPRCSSPPATRSACGPRSTPCSPTRSGARSSATLRSTGRARWTYATTSPACAS